MGTIEAVSGASFRKRVIPKIISKAKNKITKEPATAKELMSIPISFKISSPKNKNPIIIIPAVKEAFSDSIWPIFFLKVIINGTLPRMLITAKRIRLAVKISLRFSTGYFFCKCKFILLTKRF